MIKGEFIKEIIVCCEKHIDEYGFRRMSKKEFKELFKLN